MYVETFSKTRNWINISTVLFNVAVAMTAGIFTYFASVDKKIFLYGISLVHTFSFVPVVYWSLKSNYRDLGSIYYLICTPLIIGTFIATIANLCFPFQGRLLFPYNTKQRLVAVFCGPLFILLAVMILFAMHGEDTTLIKFGSSLTDLIIFGWIPFATAGILPAIASIVIWKSFSS